MTLLFSLKGAHAHTMCCTPLIQHSTTPHFFPLSIFFILQSTTVGVGCFVVRIPSYYILHKYVYLQYIPLTLIKFIYLISNTHPFQLPTFHKTPHVLFTLYFITEEEPWIHIISVKESPNFPGNPQPNP